MGLVDKYRHGIQNRQDYDQTTKPERIPYSRTHGFSPMEWRSYESSCRPQPRHWKPLFDYAVLHTHVSIKSGVDGSNYNSTDITQYSLLTKILRILVGDNVSGCDVLEGHPYEHPKSTESLLEGTFKDISNSNFFPPTIRPSYSKTRYYRSWGAFSLYCCDRSINFSY